uniref:Protein kinase domain-containing protein n=1 Tax=Amphimedon queenslandica TaxID=400682 RepID=A0A1X7UFM1_AMPQE
MAGAEKVLSDIAAMSESICDKINCIQMEERASHSFVRVSPVTLDLDETDKSRLFTAGGSIISSESIIIRDKEFFKSLGSYLTKTHISPDKLKLGVGYVKLENKVTPPTPKKIKTESNEFTIHKANQDWEYKEHDSVVPYSRKEVWEKIGKNECYASYDQPVFTSPQKPVPLVISSAHSDCQYEWKCFQKKDYSYPNSPVLYVNEPFLFKCSNCDATNDFDKRNELGNGGFGNVLRAHNLRCNAAVKVLTRDGCKALKGGVTESLQMKSELQALMKYE